MGLKKSIFPPPDVGEKGWEGKKKIVVIMAKSR
jgi:hypothetical protein